MKLKKILDNMNIDCYIPLQYKEIIKDGKRKKNLQPAIRNLVFINTSRSTLDTLKKDLEGVLPIRYLFNSSNKAPITIIDREMRQFIAVSSMYEEQLIYISLDGKLKRGDKVRVIGGIFEGIEGNIVRIKNDRRVLVTITGVIAVATAFIHPSLLQKIENGNN